MGKIASILVLILILGAVGISGCTSQGDNTTDNSSYNNFTNTANQTPFTSANNTSGYGSDSNSSKDLNTSSGGPMSASVAYIANANTGVFHYSWCCYIDKMMKNIKYYIVVEKRL